MDSVTPFIIWTFRRSGGTNLGQALFLNSDYSAVEHEPFNQDRIYGKITKSWKENKNTQNLYNAIDAILEKKPLIKHCLEIMPEELNIALIELSIKHGYKHLFLYREQAKSRLLSLNYSIKTNVWGKEHLKTRVFDEIVFDEKIPIDKLLTHENHCRSMMKKLFNTLVELKQEPLAVSFEQLYESDFDYSSQLVKQIFIELIGDKEAVTSDFLNQMLRRGGQGTVTDYLRFPNSDYFVKKLDKLLPFKLYNIVEINYSISDNLKIEHCELWPALPGIKPSQLILHGVVLAENDFEIQLANKKNIPLIKGLSSERIANLFPNNINAKNCRFLSFASDCTSLIQEVKVKEKSD